MQLGASGTEVVLCSINGTVAMPTDTTDGLQSCAKGYVCAPLSRGEIEANSRFDSKMMPLLGELGAGPHVPSVCSGWLHRESPWVQKSCPRRVLHLGWQLSQRQWIAEFQRASGHARQSMYVC